MTKAQRIEERIMELSGQLAALRNAETGSEVPDYELQTTEGDVQLSQFFAGQERMLVIHNMGDACRFCTLWADGINGILHLEDAMAVLVVSKDPPDKQRAMAMDRGWTFRMASHGGGAYMHEQCGAKKHANQPGAAVYERVGGALIRKAFTEFGPGDLYSPMWHFLSLAGVAASDWTPQFHYWEHPEHLDEDG